ncbi:MAG TPA: hypothetical protein VGC04_05050 [Cellulomonas sp.]
MSTGMHTEAATDGRRRRRGVVFLKFGLAGAALLGVAAAATSAAWTDDAWFSATAQGATVHLQGAIGTNPASTDWQDADTSTESPTLTVSSTVFGDLLPGDHRTVVLNLRNTGSTNLTLGTPVIGLVAGGDPILSTNTSDTTDVVVRVVGTATSPLAPSATTSVTLDVTVPAGWSSSNEGKSESFTVAFTGTATH